MLTIHGLKVRRLDIFIAKSKENSFRHWRHLTNQLSFKVTIQVENKTNIKDGNCLLNELSKASDRLETFTLDLFSINFNGSDTVHKK